MITRLKDLRIATIMDEFTELCYRSECNLCQLTPDNWLKEIVHFRPHLLFVESNWRGKDELWKGKGNIPTDALRGIVAYCKSRKIPTMFWNKEDPFHYQHFLPIAWMFDYIFTTDTESVSNYKRDTGNDKVFFLHFAAQPQIHNPEEKFKRENKFCFAGSYYKFHPEREVDFDNIMTALMQNNAVEIYDRNYNSGRENFLFPDIYSPFIKGSLPAKDIDKAYKGYYYNVNVNTIKTSPTMFARRVFELMSSNTVVISNYAKGMENLFGNYIIASDDPKVILSKLEFIRKDKVSYEKYRLEGLRNVLRQHLYEDRLAYVVDKIFGEKLYYQPLYIMVYSAVNTQQQWENVYRNFVRQEHKNSSMIVFVSPEITIPCSDDRVTIIPAAQKEEYMKRLDPESYIAFFNPEDYYGKHYLTDLSLALRFTDADVICRKEHYRMDSGRTCIRINPDQAYRYTESAEPSSSLFKAKYYAAMHQGKLSRVKILSIDPFNYCENYSGEALPEADDFADNYPYVDILDICKNAEVLQPAGREIKQVLEDNHFWEKTGGVFTAARMLDDGNIRLVVSEPEEKSEALMGEKIVIDRAKTYKFYLAGAFSCKAGFGCRYYDAADRMIERQYFKNATITQLEIPQNAVSLRLYARFEGVGTGFIHKYCLYTE